MSPAERALLSEELVDLAWSVSEGFANTDGEMPGESAERCQLLAVAVYCDEFTFDELAGALHLLSRNPGDEPELRHARSSALAKLEAVFEAGSGWPRTRGDSRVPAQERLRGCRSDRPATADSS